MAVYFLPSFHLLHFILSYLSPYESLLLPKLNCLHISALLSHIIFERHYNLIVMRVFWLCCRVLLSTSPCIHLSRFPSDMQSTQFTLSSLCCNHHNFPGSSLHNSLSHLLANTQPQPAHNCTHLSFSEAKLSSILPSLECLCLLEISYFCALK